MMTNSQGMIRNPKGTRKLVIASVRISTMRTGCSTSLYEDTSNAQKARDKERKRETDPHRPHGIKVYT